MHSENYQKPYSTKTTQVVSWSTLREILSAWISSRLTQVHCIYYTWQCSTCLSNCSFVRLQDYPQRPWVCRVQWQDLFNHKLLFLIIFWFFFFNIYMAACPKDSHPQQLIDILKLSTVSFFWYLKKDPAEHQTKTDGSHALSSFK